MTLVGYGFTYRYCPGGKHVAYKEGSRSPHDGDLEFISMDLHKGCGESGSTTTCLLHATLTPMASTFWIMHNRHQK